MQKLIWLSVLCAVFVAADAAPTRAQNAQDTTGAQPPPFPEVIFRRVTPPGAGHTGPRINIQIRPGDNQATTVAAPSPDVSPAPTAPTASEAAWFWSEISPAMPPDPARFWAAQTHLEAAPQTASLSIPRLNTLHQIASQYGREILMASIGTEVSPALILSVMAVESSGRAEAVSSAGAQGLMQLIPATAERFGVTDAFDTAQNIAGGTAYLNWLMGEFDRDPLLVLAGYNAGEGAVRRASGVPNYGETRNYVPKVLATWALARNLCRTPPELISDGCVFVPIAEN